MHKVFVYGSLLSGLGNHRLLETSKKLGVTKTPEGFDMLDLGYFPGAIKGQGVLIGEVYEVDDVVLKDLDRLEGYHDKNNNHNNMYNRIEIETEFGKAYIYIYELYSNNNAFKRAIVEDGDWRTHYTKKLNK